ncbi:MAG TPA: hypothetical protein ENJ95_21955, partial [Bacteroidetes bacterium]|nr:hypothetical protein [Bacteroidota bacterium]
MKTTARFTKLLTFSKPEPNQKHAPFLILENMENIKKYNVPKLRFPGFGGEWGFRKLENVIELISGQHLNADEYNSINTGIPYFTGPTDFTNNKNDLKKWTTKLKKAALKDDILITVKGSGVGTLMFLELHKVAIGRQIMALRSSVNSTLFIYQFLGTKKKYYKS